jgi:hypothetical protein
MSRKKLFEKSVQLEGGVVGRVKLLAGAARGIVQNPGTITAEQVAEWEASCITQAKEVRDALAALKAHHREIREYVKSQVQSSAPEE